MQTFNLKTELLFSTLRKHPKHFSGAELNYIYFFNLKTLKKPFQPLHLGGTFVVESLREVDGTRGKLCRQTLCSENLLSFLGNSRFRKTPLSSW